MASGPCVFTAKVTDNNGVTMVSAPVIVTVDPQPILGSEAMTANGYQFTISGGAAAAVDVVSSEDLIHWSPWGTVSLSGGSYVVLDTMVGSVAHRFYRVVEGGVCSASTVGFVKMTLPAQSSIGVSNRWTTGRGTW
ncbi:MAG: hypothetical protein U1F98_14195 [Verrucomicrobiota bacterium]